MPDVKAARRRYCGSQVVVWYAAGLFRGFTFFHPDSLLQRFRFFALCARVQPDAHAHPTVFVFDTPGHWYEGLATSLLKIPTTRTNCFEGKRSMSSRQLQSFPPAPFLIRSCRGNWAYPDATLPSEIGFAAWQSRCCSSSSSQLPYAVNVVTRVPPGSRTRIRHGRRPCLP